MFYFKFTADTPYYGTENTEYHKFKERPTNEELDEIAESFKEFNAQNFEYFVTGWDDECFDDEDERAEALEYYYSDCTCTWEEVTEEEFENEVY